jgi:membrane protease YdiL (CAAX protease family)
LKQLFFNDAGRLRVGWRLLTFILLLVALQLCFGVLIWGFYGLLITVAPDFKTPALLDALIYRFTLTATALLAGYACVRLLEGLPWRSLGISLHHKWFRHFLIGSILGVLTLVLATGIATLGGGLRFNLSSSNLLPAVAKTLLASAFLFVVAALAEEALFRGYGLQTLTRAKLAWLGVLLTSLPFAAVHLNNPNVVQPFASLNTALAGAWLAAAYLRTRSLWYPIGIHWAWNWSLGALFGLPVSGIKSFTPNPLLQSTDLGPPWLTGGSYGIEGGLACTIALVVSTIVIWRTRLVFPTDDLFKLTSEERPVEARQHVFQSVTTEQ